MGEKKLIQDLKKNEHYIIRFYFMIVFSFKLLYVVIQQETVGLTLQILIVKKELQRPNPSVTQISLP